MKECLSPRSANIQSRPPPVSKPKDKNHASPPPKYVLQPPSDDLPGEQYSMGRELGKGGFAICYEGTLLGHKHETNKFALKIVKAKMGVKKMEEKFRTELQIHSKMRHPNIVEFHQAFTFEENTYIVLELCPNGSVKDMVQKRRCLSLPEVRRYGVQLCGAIKYLHSRNVIHRDLKMGNIFLDQNMNIKLGDFGLAALLLTESDIGAVSRRTTLCGTPNYIAPEILERGRKGHDYKVDIWALGVIFFALLTGYPPFSDKVQEEIYRKVKQLDYTWPINNRNEYSAEAKALVTSLLKTNAEERPEPDQIVGHPFFSMHGGNAIPSVIELEHFSTKPQWLEDGHPHGDTMANTASRISIQALGEQCGVGSFSEKPYAIVGEHVGKSIYQELLWEEEVGKAPTVPLPENFVYSSTNRPTFIEKVKSVRATNRKAESMRVPSTRVKPIASAVSVELNEPRKILPLRSTSSRSVASMRVPNVRIRPSMKTISTESEAAEKIRPVRPKIKTIPTDIEVPEKAQLRSVSTQSGGSTRVPSYRTKSSITLVQPTMDEPKQIQSQRKGSNHSAISIPSDTASDPRTLEASSSGPPPALIGQHDTSNYISGSKPNEVIAMLENFSATLSKCLQDISIVSSPPTTLPSKPQSLETHPHVVKWVDYTNKFGIGYILANGSIGCVFNGTAQRASTCIMVPRAEDHLRKRNSPTYAERHQIVPRCGPAVEFVENRAELGLQRVLIQPQVFQINIGKNGVPNKLRPVPNSYDNEKRRMLSLWDQFAKYMTQTLGEKADSPVDPSPPAPPSQSPDPASGLFITFYQRLGNVGIWAFASGAFQFNFPDHTKLVLSPSSSAPTDALVLWADFYHLSLAAAQLLKKGRLLSKAALEERDLLSYSLATLLSGSDEGRDFRALVVANELVAKVRFVREVVRGWVRAGGLGKGGEGSRWEGAREGGGGKEAWVTVGKGGGDRRWEGGKGV